MLCCSTKRAGEVTEMIRLHGTEGARSSSEITAEARDLQGRHVPRALGLAMHQLRETYAGLTGSRRAPVDRPLAR